MGIVSGIGLIVFGIWMLRVTTGVFLSDGWNIGVFFLFLYGMIPLGLGIYILFHSNKEDQIEQIKTKEVGK